MVSVGTIWNLIGVAIFLLGFYFLLTKFSVPFFGGVFDLGTVMFFDGLVMLGLGLILLGEKVE
jgi:hypothetical protein